MKVLVCGGRDQSFRRQVFDYLYDKHQSNGIDLIINGGATGVDRAAREWAREACVPYVTCPANWSEHGKAAGPIRNWYMVDTFNPDLVVALPGGRGTENMILVAEKRGVPVHRIID